MRTQTVSRFLLSSSSQGESVKYFLDNLEKLGQSVSPTPRSAGYRPLTGRSAGRRRMGCREPSAGSAWEGKKKREVKLWSSCPSSGFHCAVIQTGSLDLKSENPAPTAPSSPLASHAPFHVMEMFWGFFCLFF